MRFHPLICSVFLTAAAFSFNARATDGFAVATNWHNPAVCEACLEYAGEPLAGQLVRYDIVGNKVVGYDTIVPLPRVVQQAAISFDGTRVAFFRWGWKVERRADGKRYLIDSTRNSPCYISIVKKDGTGFRDVLKLPKNGTVGHWQCGTVYGYGWDNQLDWPAGEWVYYEQPDKTGIIRRVNVNTGADELVVAYSGSSTSGCTCYIRRWSLSADAKWQGYQMECGGGGVAGACFPPPGGNNGGCSATFALNGCNGAVSASGNFLGSYFAGCHEDCRQAAFPHDKGHLSGNDTWPYDRGGTDFVDLAAWSGEPANMFGCAEWVRWSANSDKWYGRMITPIAGANNFSCGSNQVLTNWIDSAAIITSKNPRHTANPYCPAGENSDAGDFWVNDPVHNPDHTKYENIDGTWTAVAGATPVIEAFIHHSGSPDEMRISVQGTDLVLHLSATASRIEMRDLSGRTFGTYAARGMLRIPRSQFPRGMCLVTIRNGAFTRTAKIAAQ